MITFSSFNDTILLPSMLADYWQWSLVMWVYVWLVRRHLSPPWEDEDGFQGEVRAQGQNLTITFSEVAHFTITFSRSVNCSRLHYEYTTINI